MWIIIGLLLVVHFLVVVFLTIIVLMQRTKEGGMGSAFGAGVTESLFGASSGNVLTKITVWAAGIFFATSLVMAMVFSHMKANSTISGRQFKKPPAGAVPTNLGTTSGAPTGEGMVSGTGTATTPQSPVTPAAPPAAPSGTATSPAPALPETAKPSP